MNSKSGTYNSARLSARVQRAKTTRLWTPFSALVSGCFALHHAEGITTGSLAYRFCDGPSGIQVMPLLLADPSSLLTSLVNLDGTTSRLCHLPVIA